MFFKFFKWYQIAQHFTYGLWVLKPFFFLQYKACCTSYWAPQMHWVSSRNNSQPYFNFIKSQNFYLFKQYLLSFSVNVDSHIDAPFPWCMSFNFSFSSDKEYNFFVFYRSFSSLIFVSSIFISSLFLIEALLMMQLQLLSCRIHFQWCQKR